MRKLLTTSALGLAAVGLASSTVAASPPPAPSPTIVDLAVNASGMPNEFDGDRGDFDILVAAVLALGLDDDLSSSRQLTAFAPTDGAFVALAEALDDSDASLTEAEAFGVVAGVPGVTQVVLHHVAPGERFAADVVPATKVRTLNGDFIEKASGAASLDAGLGRTANIIGVDLDASNGVVHVIDQVLLP